MSVGGIAHAAKQVPLGCIAPYATALPWHISPSVKTFGFVTSLAEGGEGIPRLRARGYGFPRQ